MFWTKTTFEITYCVLEGSNKINNRVKKRIQINKKANSVTNAYLKSMYNIIRDYEEKLATNESIVF